MEHIFGDALLNSMNLKNMLFKYNATDSGKEYSRLKTPAHTKCNNEFGSRFETEIIKLINSFDGRGEERSKLHLSCSDNSTIEIKAKLLTWLAKIYLGLVCWESGVPDMKIWNINLVSSNY